MGSVFIHWNICCFLSNFSNCFYAEIPFSRFRILKMHFSPPIFSPCKINQQILIAKCWTGKMTFFQQIFFSCLCCTFFIPAPIFDICIWYVQNYFGLNIHFVVGEREKEKWSGKTWGVNKVRFNKTAGTNTAKKANNHLDMLPPPPKKKV